MHDPDSSSLAQRPAAGRRKRVCLRLALSLLTFALLLLALEFGLRVFGDVRPRLLVLDDKLGQTFQPGWEGRVYDREALREVLLHFDRDGCRTPDRPYEKPAGLRRVVVLGDSMMAGTAVGEQRTAALLLEARLRALHPEQAWEVINLAIPGFGTGQEYLTYREIGRRYSPDLVLCVFFAGNDFSDNGSAYSDSRRPYFDVDERGDLVQRPFPPLIFRIRDALDRYSRLYLWQKRLARGRPIHPQERKPTGQPEYVYCTAEDEHMAASWRVARAAIRSLVRECAAGGARFAMVLLPATEQVHDEIFAEHVAAAGELGPALDREHPSRRLAGICDGLEVPFIDLLPAFRAAAPTHSDRAQAEWLYLNGFGHLNEAGHALVAEELLRHLPELLGGRNPAH